MPVVHFQNFMALGITLCGVALPLDPRSSDAVTSQPDHVTCPACLARMGRRPPAA